MRLVVELKSLSTKRPSHINKDNNPERSESNFNETASHTSEKTRQMD